MRENRDEVIRFIIKQEVNPGEELTGSYHCDGDDPGGCTKFGISQKAFPTLNIKDLTLQDARVLYTKKYWDAMNGDNLLPGLDLIAVDFAVNAGVPRVKVYTGRISNETLPVAAVKIFANIRREYYKHLAATNPKLEKFLKDWLVRTDRAEEAATELAMDAGESSV